MGKLKHRRPVLAPDVTTGQMGPIASDDHTHASTSAPVRAVGAAGNYTVTATWTDIGGAVGRVRATVPATGTYLVHYQVYGTMSGTTGNADLAMRLTKDGTPVSDSVAAVGRCDSTVNPTTDRFGASGLMALSLTANEEIEIEVVKTESAAHTVRVETDGSRGTTKLELIHYR
jgi:hypothetical protein